MVFILHPLPVMTMSLICLVWHSRSLTLCLSKSFAFPPCRLGSIKLTIVYITQIPFLFRSLFRFLFAFSHSPRLFR